VLAAAALLAGCSGASGKSGGGTSAAPSATTSSPFADCAALTSPPSPASAGAGAASTGAGASSGGAGAANDPLPDLGLPCFTGGRIVHVGQIRGPALINLWASWCAPCRDELPVFQRLAGRVDGRVHVVGVVSRDDRDAAQSLAAELGITFPALDDRQAALLGRVGRAALPVTLFVNAKDRISYVYNSVPLDDAGLARLVDRYLGVVVPA
jgi:thiol-disulfide isomerase/thioredoxin